MKILTTFDEMDFTEGTGIALGNFDGLHLGHQALITAHIRACLKHGLKAGVFTFSNHPLTFMRATSPFSLLMQNEEKVQFFSKLGVDFLFFAHFDETMKNLSAEQFVDTYLCNGFHAKVVTAGENYRFGNCGLGTPEYLKNISHQKGFEVQVVPLLEMDGQIVSSTVIRQALSNGDIQKANHLLGRDFSVTGTVEEGKKLGRTLGFPTLNLYPPNAQIVPKFGVYITNTIIEGKRYPSITNVGQNPTVGDGGVRIETHIFDFADNLYGKKISVSFLAFVRGEVKFNGIDALKSQIDEDVKKAREYFAHL